MIFKAKVHGRIAGRVVSMVAKYHSICKCGAFIEPGDEMSYDTISRKSLCYDCLRLSTQFLGQTKDKISSSDEEKESREFDALIDRFRELRVSPRPISDQTRTELIQILIRFRNEFGANESVRAFVWELAQCKHRGAEYCPVRTKYPGSCIHCGETVSIGQLVFYDHHARRIHCLVCDCLRDL